MVARYSDKYNAAEEGFRVVKYVNGSRYGSEIRETSQEESWVDKRLDEDKFRVENPDSMMVKKYEHKSGEHL